MKEERVTIVQLARFGDLIQTSPLIRNLNREPGYDREITLLVDKRSSPAAKLLEGVDNIIEIDLNEGSQVSLNKGHIAFRKMTNWVESWKPRQTSDRLILLNQGELTAAVASMIPARIRQGPLYGHPLPGPHQYLTASIRDRRFSPLHLCEVWAAYGPPLFPLLEPKLRRSNTGTTLAFYNDKGNVVSSKSKRYAVNIGAGGQERIWSSAKLAALVDSLLKKGAEEVLLLGTRTDCPLAEEVIRRINPDLRTLIVDLCGKTQIEDLPGLLDMCVVLISSDTGTLQLAAATSAKPLGLFFGGANPHETGAFVAGAVAVQDASSLNNNANGADNIDPVTVAEIAVLMAKNTSNWKEYHDNSTISLLVARSAPVAPEYRPVNASSEQIASWERRRSFARTLLWESESPSRQTREERDVLEREKLPLDMELMNGLNDKRIHDKRFYDFCLPVPSQVPRDSAEGRWYRGLLEAGARGGLEQADDYSEYSKG